MDLIIDRSKWLRGEGSSESYLLRSKDGCMCCLGFFCIQQGLGAEEIENVSTPAYIKHLTREDIETWGLRPLISDQQYDSGLCENLTMVNDDGSMSDVDREAQIITFFAEMNVTVTFIN